MDKIIEKEKLILEKEKERINAEMEILRQKISVFERVYCIQKPIMFFILGIILIIFHNVLYDYLAFIVGGMTMLFSIENIILDIKNKIYLRHDNTVGMHLAGIIVGILIVCHFRTNSFEFVIITWGLITILKSSLHLFKTISTIKHNWKKSIIELMWHIASLVLAILLVIDPFEHVVFHMVILGVEMLLESLIYIEENWHVVRYGIR